MWRTFNRIQKRAVMLDGATDAGSLIGQAAQVPTPAPAAAVTPPAPTDTIVLTKKEYSEMTSQMASMKTALEALLDEDPNKGKQQPAQAQPDLSSAQIDSMSNTQLLQMVGEHVSKVVNESRQPLIDALATIAVKEELREVKAEYTDFDSFSSDIQTMAKGNPQLSLKQCYLLVKAGKPAPAAPETKPVPTPADRGGIHASAATQQKGMSVREAAEAALKSVKYE